MAGKLKGFGIITFLAILCSGPTAWAAERVLLNYRGFSRTVAVQDLATLAESGEAPDNLASLLNAAGQRPEQLRSLLTNSLTADPVLLGLEFRQIGSSCTVKSAQSLEPREMSQRSTDGAPKRWTELETWAWNSSF
jgi:hypothetical protein